MAAPMLVIVRMLVKTPTDEVASACELISPHERSCSAPAKIYILTDKEDCICFRKKRKMAER
jgi:hypothetical protein